MLSEEMLKLENDRLHELLGNPMTDSMRYLIKGMRQALDWAMQNDITGKDLPSDLIVRLLIEEKK